MAPNKQDREGFRLFCKQATDTPRVLDIYLNEVEAAQWDDEREDYVDIALEEYLRRREN